MAIVNTGPDTLAWRELSPPEPGAGQVRIRTAACGICATDLKLMAAGGRGEWPRVLGHEWSGTVDAVGPGGDGALRGRRCVAENVLADGGEVGFEHPGAYAERFLTEAANLHLLPERLPSAEAALIEPLAVCVRGLDRLRPRPDAAALVFGDGPIGLLMVALLRHSGLARVDLVGGRAARLEVARGLGANAVENYHDAGADLAGHLRARRGEYGAIVEASGSAVAMNAAIALAGRDGSVLVIGDYEEARADFAWQQVLHRELTIVGSNASAGAWPRAVALAASGAVPLAKLITARFPAAAYAEAVALARSARDQIKVIMEWR